MNCFEATERVRRGLRIQYPNLVMGYGAHEVRIPMWGGDRAWLRRHLGDVREGELFLFTRANLRQQDGALWLTTSPPDDWALVLVRTAPGVGGGLFFRHNRRVGTLVETDFQGQPEKLLRVSPGGLLRIRRDGDLEGAPPEIILGWDGRRMHELHESAWQ